MPRALRRGKVVLAGSHPWSLFNAVAYDLVTIPLLAALLLFLLVFPRAILKSQMSGLSLLVTSLVIATMALLVITWALATLLTEIQAGPAMVRVLASALLLSAWAIPREILSQRR